MGDYIRRVELHVELQENGWIRLLNTGEIIGKLIENDEKVNFERLSRYEVGSDSAYSDCDSEDSDGK